MYDLIIIGGGPAGIAAAVYAARKRMNFLVVTGDIGGQTLWTSKVENYIGFQFISGLDLVAKFEEHVRQYNIPIKEGEKVTGISRKSSVFAVETDAGSYDTRSIVIASGKKSRELNVPGEKEFLGKGVAYCATCDAPLFGGKDVAVIGGGNSALDAAIQLEKIANKIYLVNIAPQFRGDAILQEKIAKSRKVAVYHEAQVSSIKGDTMVTGITVKGGMGEQALSVQGVFVEIGLVPNAEFIPFVKKNEHGEIIINCSAETNVPGIFAAGDVTSVKDKQIIIAAGEGAKAVLSAFRYVSRLS